MCCTVQTSFQQKAMTVFIVFMMEDVIGILGVISLFLYDFKVIGSNTSAVPIRDETEPKAIFIAALVIATAFFVLDFVMNIYVWIGASRGDLKKCIVWFIHSDIAIGLSAILVILTIVMVLTDTPNLGNESTEIPCRLFLVALVHLCLRGYGSYAMKYLIADIRQNPEEYQQTVISEETKTLDAENEDSDPLVP